MAGTPTRHLHIISTSLNPTYLSQFLITEHQLPATATPILHFSSTSKKYKTPRSNQPKKTHEINQENQSEK